MRVILISVTHYYAELWKLTHEICNVLGPTTLDGQWTIPKASSKAASTFGVRFCGDLLSYALFLLKVNENLTTISYSPEVRGVVPRVFFDGERENNDDEFRGLF